jgi:hypothetical protein
MNAATVFEAEVLDDGKYRIALAQTGPDSLSADIEKWAVGADTSAPSADDTSEALSHVRVRGDVLTADGPTFGFWLAKIVPKVTITLSPAGQTPSVHIVVTGTPMSNSDKAYPISQADHDAYAKFIADAKFPAA